MLSIPGSYPSPIIPSGSNFPNNHECFDFVNKFMNFTLTPEDVDEFHDKLINDRIGMVNDRSSLGKFVAEALGEIYKRIPLAELAKKFKDYQSGKIKFSDFDLDVKIGLNLQAIQKIVMGLDLCDQIQTGLKERKDVDEAVLELRKLMMGNIEIQNTQVSYMQRFLEEVTTSEALSATFLNRCQSLTNLFFSLFSKDKSANKTDSLSASEIKSSISPIIDDFSNLRRLNNTLNKLKYAQWTSLILEAKIRLKPFPPTHDNTDVFRTFLKNYRQAIYEQLFEVNRDYPLSFDPDMIEMLEKKSYQQTDNDLFYQTILSLSKRDIPTNVDEKWSNFLFLLDAMKSTQHDLIEFRKSLSGYTFPEHQQELHKAIVNSSLSFMTQYPQLFGEDDRFPKGEIEVVCGAKQKGDWTLSEQTLVWDLASGKVVARVKTPETPEDPRSRIVPSFTEVNKTIPFEELEGYIGTVYKVSQPRNNPGKIEIMNLSESVSNLNFSPAFTYEVVFGFLDKLIEQYNRANPT